MLKDKNTYIALIVMALWGLTFPIIKIGYSLYSIDTVGDLFLFAGVRFLISSVITFAYAVKKEKVPFKVVKKNFPMILLVSLFAIILQNVFTYPALQMTQSSNASILKQSVVLLYVGLSFLFFKDDKPNLRKIIGAVLGFCGIIVMNYTSQGIDINLGNLLMICASLCIVIASILYKKLFAHVPPITSTAITQFIGGVVLLILGIIFGGKIQISNVIDIWLLLCLGLVSSISYILWYIVVSKVELSKLFIIKMSEPIFSCLFAALLLGENILTPKHLISIVLIFSGIYISNRK